jgi:hypothetical protein
MILARNRAKDALDELDFRMAREALRLERERSKNKRVYEV